MLGQIANDNAKPNEDFVLVHIFKFLSLVMSKNLFKNDLDKNYIKKMLEKNLLSLTE